MLRTEWRQSVVFYGCDRGLIIVSWPSRFTEGQATIFNVNLYIGWLTRSAVGKRYIAYGYVRRVLHLLLRFIAFRALSAHLTLARS